MSHKLHDLYSVEEAYWDTDGVRISMHLSWSAISDMLALDDNGIVSDEEDLPQKIVDEAFQETSDLLAELSKQGITLEEDERLELENTLISDKIEERRADKVLPDILNLDKLVKDANSWCKKGCSKPELFGTKPAAGLGLVAWQDTTGITFTIYKPFVIVFYESYYHQNRQLPDKNLDDLTAEDVFDILLLVQDCCGTKLHQIINLKELAEL